MLSRSVPSEIAEMLKPAIERKREFMLVFKALLRWRTGAARQD
jgi:hypothetical protein